jgi:hypothetical protein
MANYLRAAVMAIDAALQARTPALLEALGRPAFTEFRRADTRIMPNPPTCWVTPLRNAIGDEGQALPQLGQVLVTIGLAGTDPDELVRSGMDYMAAVTDAIESVAEWTPNIRHVHPGAQDYSARIKMQSGFAIFPTVTVTVEATEVSVVEW